MRLNSVVLPQPFGPMMARIPPLSRTSEMSSAAVTPPNVLTRCSSRSTRDQAQPGAGAIAPNGFTTARPAPSSWQETCSL